jgi:hypothetical protein
MSRFSFVGLKTRSLTHLKLKELMGHFPTLDYLMYIVFGCAVVNELDHDDSGSVYFGRVRVPFGNLLERCYVYLCSYLYCSQFATFIGTRPPNDILYYDNSIRSFENGIVSRASNHSSYDLSTITVLV